MNCRQSNPCIRQKAIEFANKYNLLQFDFFTVKQILEQLGYRVVEYSEDFSKTAEAIKGADGEMSEMADVFIKENIRCVFVRESLSDVDKTVLLAAQTGNVILFGGIEEMTRSRRYDCLTFALCLREMCREKGPAAWFSRHKAGALAAVATLLLIACMSLSSVVLYFSTAGGTTNPLDSLAASVGDFAEVQIEQNDIFDANAVFAFSSVDPLMTENSDVAQSDTEIMAENPDEAEKINQEISAEYFYVTKSGKKYHVSSCSYIKDVSACTKVGIEDVLEKGYEPCKRCIKE